MMTRICSLTLFLAIAFTSNVFANIRLPAIIGDNMVLQADANAPIWGWADPNESITISIADQKLKTIADKNGMWKVFLNPIHPSTQPLEMTITSRQNTITLRNILVGQVWLGSGQSNMAFKVANANDANTEIKNADFPKIRLFIVIKAYSCKPLDNCNGQWVECSPKTVGDFSAVLYFFGRDIHTKLQQPVGLIFSSWGGSVIEAWTSEPALKSEPAAKSIYDFWKKIIAEYPAAMKTYNEDLTKWQRDTKTKTSAKSLPQQPQNPDCPQRPSFLYNAMICPVMPFAIKGVLWYQGESNASSASQYSKLFPLMIADWRKQWNQGDFPFYFVQLANYNSPGEPKGCWAKLRQVQLETFQTVPNTGMAVTIDIGEANDIHPKNKQEVGRRLALMALAKTYNYNIVFSGPFFKSMRTAGNKVILTFDHTDGGLIAKGNVLKGFTIADADHVFVDADASIVDNEVVVYSSKILSPVSVRYAWADNPQGCNLYNGIGLPASPFKTDN